MAASPAGVAAEVLAVLRQVLALPEPERSGSLRLVVARAREWERCGTARGKDLGGHARG